MPSSILNSDDGVISGTSGLKSSGGDDGALAVQSNGTEVAKFKTTELVINDGGANYDFRVEGDTNANLLCVDASTDRVGIGTNSPESPLEVEVNSTVNTNSIFLDNIGAMTVGQGSKIEWRNGTVTVGDTAAISGIVTSTTSGARGTGLAFYTNAQGTGLTEKAQIDHEGYLKFDSGYGSVATAYGCRAWVNFNGTGTPAIREDGNVSSITDNATGDYTVNYATSLVDANGAVIVTAGGAGGANGDESIESTFSQTASAVRLIIRLYTSTTQDTTFVNFAVFR